MTQYRPLALFLIAAILCTSCERLLMADDIPATATHTFGHLWQQVDKQYSLFDVKQVDWQAVYDSLSPRVYDGMTADSLYVVADYRWAGFGMAFERFIVKGTDEETAIKYFRE